MTCTISLPSDNELVKGPFCRINWTPHQYIKNHGTCNAVVPVWVDLEVVDNITSRWSGSTCESFREEQLPDVYEMQRKLDICRDQNMTYKEIVDNA